VTDVVRLDVDDRGITWITLARPEVRNAFDADLVAQLNAILGDIDPTTRAVVLRSEGEAFCAGADLNWMRGMADFSLAENVADSRALAQMFRALDELPMPLLARVQGAAIGGGCGLVAVADVAVASTESVYAFTEVRLGIIPAVVSPFVLGKIGESAARRYFLTAETLTAAMLKALGLVHEVVSRGQLDACCRRITEALLRAAPGALSEAKTLIRDVASTAASQRAAASLEAAARLARLRVQGEAQEGFGAFFAKRKAAWRPD